MKTLTEFTGSVIRTASKAVAEAEKSLPRQANEAAAPAPEAPAAPVAGQPAAEAPAAPAEAAGEAPEQAGAPSAEGEAKPAGEPKPDGEARPDGDAKPGEEAKQAEEAKPGEEAKPAEKPAAPEESPEVKAALDAAVEKATGLSGDRLARLREALKAVGRRVDDVRLVRVFGPEEPVPGATTVGGFQYVVELMPASMKQVMTTPERDRGRGRGRPGGGRPGGATGKNPASATTGGFSMDAVRADRANERRGGRFGGRPGGGGRGPGGGRGFGGGRRPGGGGRRGA